MFDQQSTNAVADFLTRDSGAWNMSIGGVRVLYEPQGTAYVNQSSGDVVQREERILGPLGLDQHVAEGDRIVMTYRSDVFDWRVTDFRARSLDGIEGYCQLGFEDYDDSESGDDSDWDIGT